MLLRIVQVFQPGRQFAGAGFGLEAGFAFPGVGFALPGVGLSFPAGFRLGLDAGGLFPVGAGLLLVGAGFLLVGAGLGLDPGGVFVG